MGMVFKTTLRQVQYSNHSAASMPLPSAKEPTVPPKMAEITMHHLPTTVYNEIGAAPLPCKLTCTAQLARQAFSKPKATQTSARVKRHTSCYLIPKLAKNLNGSAFTDYQMIGWIILIKRKKL